MTVRGKGASLIRKSDSKAPKLGIVQKVFSEKASAIERMRQKCVKNASKWVFFLLGKEARSKMGQNCVKNASKMHGTPSGENTFWTIPTNTSVTSEAAPN